MASSLNKCLFIGHLGKDPEVRRTANGDAAVSFSLAVTESWRDKSSGERRERTEWVPIVIFNEGLGKVAEQYLKKGSKVFIEGAMQTRKWQDKDGNDRYTTEIVLQKFRGELTILDGRKDGDAEPRQERQERRQEPARGGMQPRQSSYDDMDSDIPF